MPDIKSIVEEYKGKPVAILGNGPTSKHIDGTFLDFSKLYENI